jgi:hypothetical protein
MSEDALAKNGYVLRLVVEKVDLAVGNDAAHPSSTSQRLRDTLVLFDGGGYLTHFLPSKLCTTYT